MEPPPVSPSDPFDLLKLPYAERQRLVVVDDELATELGESRVVSRFRTGAVDWAALGERALKVALGVAEFFVPIDSSPDDGVPASPVAALRRQGILAVGRREARALELPPGHPRDCVIYIGHPAVAAIYYPAAGFHRLAFEHKFSEAVHLLMALGATDLEVEHVRGWSEEFAADMAIPLPVAAANVGAKAGGKRSSASSAMFRAKLGGSQTPQLPEGLVWYPHEPTWQRVADGRLHHGLKEFQLAVRYDDDYGVNAGLKAIAQRVGLELGGNFQEHEATTWKITGTFEA